MVLTSVPQHSHRPCVPHPTGTPRPRQWFASQLSSHSLSWPSRVRATHAQLGGESGVYMPLWGLTLKSLLVTMSATHSRPQTSIPRLGQKAMACFRAPPPMCCDHSFIGAQVSGGQKEEQTMGIINHLWGLSSSLRERGCPPSPFRVAGAHWWSCCHCAAIVTSV